ncbi:MAG: RluA family pseudouridine synthase [Dehalococcoidia bacterium]
MSERVRHFRALESGRIDRVVAAALPELSRAQARKLVEGGHVSVDGASVEKPAQEVAAGLDVRVELPVLPQLDLLAADVPLEVLYEDEETLVIDKAPGLIVHPAPGIEGVTLVDVVRARYPEVREIDDSYRTGIVHRLDRDTSGVMALAKSAVAQDLMKDQWREREPVKVYLAIAEGRMDPPDGIIEAPLGPDPSRPARRAVIEGGQSARSQFRTLEQFGDEAALLEVRIFTGRTHQIRVHLQAIGHPVLGDTMYGQASDVIGRQALHASRLTFTLASTGETRTFEAPLPKDFASALETLRARHAGDASEAVLEAGGTR